ncbi:MAG TPA: acetyltransferase [Ruania sp.]|nr:acetyltransferase [Ruania sp.]
MTERDYAVIRADDPRRDEFEVKGWEVSARSWAGQLTTSTMDTAYLRVLADRGREYGELRLVGPDDIAAVLALDRATLEDYPGGIATRHEPLTPERAVSTASRRGFGVFNTSGGALAVTYVETAGRHAETEFTVVARDYRGQGLGRAVKAGSILALGDDGVTTFRTGGSVENAASLAVNQDIGYVLDEHWLTLVRSRGQR